MKLLKEILLLLTLTATISLSVGLAFYVYLGHREAVRTVIQPGPYGEGAVKRNGTWETENGIAP